MKRFSPIGWRNESYRHSLASRGISTRLHRTSFADKPLVPVPMVRSPSGKMVEYGAIPYAYDESAVEAALREAGITDPVQIEEYKQIAKTLLEEEDVVFTRQDEDTPGKIRYVTSGRKPKGKYAVGYTIPSTEGAISWEEYEFMDSEDKRRVMIEIWDRNSAELLGQGYRDVNDFIKNSSDLKKKDYIMKAFFEDTAGDERLQKNILQRGAVLNDWVKVIDVMPEKYDVEGRQVALEQYDSEGNLVIPENMRLGGSVMYKTEYIPSLPSQSEADLKMRMENAQTELDMIMERSIKSGSLDYRDEDRIAQLAKVLSPSSINRLRAIEHMKGLRLYKKLQNDELKDKLKSGAYTEDDYNQISEKLNDNFRQLLVEDAEILKASNVEAERYKDNVVNYVNAYIKGGALDLAQKRIGGYLSIMKRAEPGVSQSAYNNAVSELKSINRYLTDEQRNRMSFQLQAAKEILDDKIGSAQRAEAQMKMQERVAKMRGERKPASTTIKIGKIRLPAGTTMDKLTDEQKKVVNEVVQMQLEKYKKMMGVKRK